MSVKITPDEAAQLYADRLSGATERIRKGIERVDTAPGVKAAEHSEEWFAGLQAAHSSGKWKDRVAAVSLPDWKKAITEKGLPRIGPGARAAQPKMAGFFKELFPHIEAGQRAIEGKRKLTLEDSIDRMVTFTRHMATFKRS